jgi:predicted RNA binding protein YcfA (HicA-like mRNA interferase family)
MAFKSVNLPLSTVRKILLHEGCNLIRENKGHEKYSRKDLLRPITIQNHIDPVPEFIVKQIMRTLKLSNSDMEKILKKI